MQKTRQQEKSQTNQPTPTHTKKNPKQKQNKKNHQKKQLSIVVQKSADFFLNSL